MAFSQSGSLFGQLMHGGVRAVISGQVGVDKKPFIERIAQIAFDTLPENISLGEMAEVTLRLPAKQAQILVPNASLKRQGEQTGVWVYRSGKAQFIAVKPGKTSLDGQVEILEGLSDGEQVIVHSEKEIVADSRLKVVDSLTGAGK